MLGILSRLAEGEASVAELAEPFDISQPAISKHLKILERAELISIGQDGQRRPRRLEAKPLADASAWIERYRELWEVSFERCSRSFNARRPTGAAGRKGGREDEHGPCGRLEERNI